MSAASTTVADTWLPNAYALLKAAGFEATFTNAALVLELAGRLLLAAGRVAFQVAREYPLPAGIVGAGLGVIAFVAFRSGTLNGDLTTGQTRGLSRPPARCLSPSRRRSPDIRPHAAP